ncbi:hypothetical protein L5515_017502 [Caenorhabditis briggsae]|uniref:Uncharacterized protein n=1 Tax=Caenorhabditis briggsae TaxID=6238 RepID=A0AAE9JQY3_CAEBR|nr:hypothetical protein L5515_017502 [Caenorhabditis briggsae]
MLSFLTMELIRKSVEVELSMSPMRTLSTVRDASTAPRRADHTLPRFFRSRRQVKERHTHRIQAKINERLNEISSGSR